MTYLAPAPLWYYRPSVPQVTWGTGGANICLQTVDRTGYWWAYATVEILSGSGDNQTIQLYRLGDHLIDQDVIPGVGGRACRLLGTAAPTFMINGNQFQLYAFAASNPANNNSSRSYLTCGFVPTPDYPS